MVQRWEREQKPDGLCPATSAKPSDEENIAGVGNIRAKPVKPIMREIWSEVKPKPPKGTGVYQKTGTIAV